MTDRRSTLTRLVMHAAFVLLGVVGTAVVTTVLVNLLQPIQRVVYSVLYLQSGPSSATITAILAHFLLAGVAGIGIVVVVGEYLGDRLEYKDAIAPAIAFLAALPVVFLALAVAGVRSQLAALAVLGAAILGVPLIVYHLDGVRSRGLTAFAGGVPVLVVFLLLAGIGIGWGWGYTVTAEQVPAGSVDDADVVSFDSAPEVRDDLFASDCERDGNDTRVCRLQLRGYEHEAAAAGFLASHGVRCPYQNTPDRTEDALVTRHDGDYYRVTCSPHGD